MTWDKAANALVALTTADYLTQLSACVGFLATPPRVRESKLMIDCYAMIFTLNPLCKFQDVKLFATLSDGPVPVADGQFVQTFSPPAPNVSAISIHLFCPGVMTGGPHNWILDFHASGTTVKGVEIIPFAQAVRRIQYGGLVTDASAFSSVGVGDYAVTHYPVSPYP